LGLDPNNEDMRDEKLAARWVRDYEIDSKVLQAVQDAKRLGYKTCVCTNNNAIRLPLLVAEYKLNDLFDVIVSSHEEGVTKPDPEIFKALLDMLKVFGVENAGELIYSDDNENRLQGAKDLGINTFKFENFEQFLGKLKETGVNLSEPNIRPEGNIFQK
jgi:HAD superfamily hydrolase (TIGR01509 family)